MRYVNDDDVLKVIERFIGYLDEDMIERIKIAIKKDVPTLERPRGEWVLDQEFSFVFNMYECSKCRFNGSKRWHFCPNCGASMLANDRQVIGKLEQNFPFRLDCPCDDCKKMCIKCVDSCKKFREWKEGEEK